ncbi:AAA family ATPase [Allocoprobacillus halotolerans]|uniref:AAA family ATPase n=1 Tax=Allocoprobacillus halotolerans TaxID=2944914 RepID=A0ABY5I4Y6_9FIRM|nr:AAA family ATPase [Allocoprobacillus halotolerans]UTY40130.1 AAA family ATPase [Allocoprobacillus halotolerans]
MLCIENMNITWDKKVLGVIDAQFYEGEISVITGTNGIGKTTLLYYLALLKTGTGKYQYHQQVIDLQSSQTHLFRYQYIYFLLQELSLYDDMILQDYLDMMAGKSSYDVPFPLNKKIKDFSLGEKQYLLLYGGYLQDKAIYLLDEPTSALDTHMKEKVLELLKQLKAKGKIIIIVTHDQELIQQSDCHYHFENKQLECIKKTISHHSLPLTPASICQKSLLKMRIHSLPFRYTFCFLMILTCFYFLIGSFVFQKEKSIQSKLVNSTRQNIIVSHLEKPDIQNINCQIEPYYLYQYQDYTFVKQAFPLTYKQKSIQLNNTTITYYENKDTCYIKKDYPLLEKHQVGYLITFDDPYVYPSLMRQLYAQYEIQNIQSLYMEKENRETLTMEKDVIVIFYRILLFGVTLLIVSFYFQKMQRYQIKYILIMTSLGIAYKNQFKLLFYEIIGMMLVSLMILYAYPIEWTILFIVVCINYLSLLCYFQKNFATIYRLYE